MLLIAAFNSNAQTQNTSPAKDTAISIAVGGIRCGGDLPIICKRVNQEKGITECKARGEAEILTVFNITYNPKEISYQQIVKAIEDAPSCDFPNEKPYKVKKKK